MMTSHAVDLVVVLSGVMWVILSMDPSLDSQSGMEMFNASLMGESTMNTHIPSPLFFILHYGIFMP